MKDFLIIANDDRDIDLSVSRRLIKYIGEKGGTARLASDMVSHYENGVIKEELIRGAECCIVLGGDGTMLHAAQGIGGRDIPLMGINLGTLGFLTEVERSHAEEAVDRLLSDDIRIEERMMIKGSSDGFAEGSTYHVLNDVVITRAGFSRIIALKIYVNDQLLDTYRADGVIISTPTGSTGYNLSAGGPIVSPSTRAIIVTPISPHKLSAKSIVFDARDRIRVCIEKGSRTQDTEAIVTYDGEENIGLSYGDEIEVVCSERSIKLVRIHDTNFYSVLRDKIGG